jgi:hypothetical protein
MKWGEITWITLHTISMVIPEQQYGSIKNELMFHTKRLCNNLPCPDCTQHATDFMRNMKVPTTLLEYQRLIHFFHNTVNARLGKPVVSFEYLDTYKKFNLTLVFHSFMKILKNQPYNPRLSMNKMGTANCLHAFHVFLGKNGLITK